MSTSSPSSARRRPRRAATVTTNYSESQHDDILDDQLGPRPRRRFLTPEARQRETETEAMIALSLGFPIEALLDNEPKPSSSLNDYIVIRNHILAQWRANVRSFLSKSQVKETVSSNYDQLISSAYDFLRENGYINFGVSPAIRALFVEEPDKGSVVIVGAGLAGLAAARQLLSFGFRVLVIEGRDRPGGRVYTKKMGKEGKYAAVDLGGSVITGIHANPLGVLARQLGIPLHKIRDNCPLFRPDGSGVDGELDVKVDLVFNKLLEHAAKLREFLGEAAGNVSLGYAIEKLRKLYGVAKSVEERQILNWHLANLEYANAGCVMDLSLAHWDQDDPFEMGGDHCFLAGGNWRLINALCEDVPILYQKTVTQIEHGNEGVEVTVAGGQVFRADMVLCTVPLGVLKAGNIKFNPELPKHKLDAIQRLGFGLLNKVAMVFPRVFWGEELDTFGCFNEDHSKRGEFFLFYGYHTVSGGAVLIALVAGEAALAFEETNPLVSLHRVLDILRGIYGPKGVSVPDPIQTVCTRWGSDPLCQGSYSHVRVGSSGKDYDILAESIGGRLFFAGEATTREHPATMHGAFLSGFREASRILHAWRSKETSTMESKKLPQKNLRLHNEVLLHLFEEPDLSFGIFSFVFDPLNNEDLKATGLMKITFATSSSEDGRSTSKEEFDQHSQSSDSHLQPLHLYSLLSREQVDQITLVDGDDIHKLELICKNFGLKLMGSDSICLLYGSFISSISGARKGRNRLPRGVHSKSWS